MSQEVVFSTVHRVLLRTLWAILCRQGSLHIICVQVCMSRNVLRRHTDSAPGLARRGLQRSWGPARALLLQFPPAVAHAHMSVNTGNEVSEETPTAEKFGRCYAAKQGDEQETLTALA